jgi:hypothetical protein
VVGVFFPLFGDGFHQFFFDLLYRLALGKAGAVGDAEDVGIDGDGVFAKSGVQDHIGGFAANPG